MSAADWLEVLQLVRGVDIVLSTPDGSLSVPICAVKGKTTGQVIGDDGSLTRFDLVDWLVTVEQVALLGRPRRGYVVTWDDQTYTVAHPDQKSEAVPFHSIDETTYRIHTVRD